MDTHDRGTTPHDPHHGHLHDHDHASGAHGHGDPFVWDPSDEMRASDRRRGRLFIVAGVLLVAGGAFLWWLSTQ